MDSVCSEETHSVPSDAVGTVCDASHWVLSLVPIKVLELVFGDSVDSIV